MGRQRNRRIFAGFYRRYDGRYIYVVAVVPDADTDEKSLFFIAEPKPAAASITQ